MRQLQETLHLNSQSFEGGMKKRTMAMFSLYSFIRTQSGAGRVFEVYPGVGRFLKQL